MRRSAHALRLATLGLATLALSIALLAGAVFASSHREAPMIASDGNADNTDTYAFVSPENDGTVTLIANYVPFEEPMGGPNGEVTISTRETWELAADGKTLSVNREQTTPRGPNSSTMVFVKK